MLEDIRSHKIHYLMLLIILIFGFGSFLYFSFDRQSQFVVGILTSISYALWGIAHHYGENNLNWKIVVEYSLFAALAIVIIESLILRT